MSPPGDDDQQWLDLLAGRAAPDADARTRKEAAWLRAALLSYRVSAPPGAPAHADDRISRLLTRARGAGVLPAAANDDRLPGQPATRSYRHRWPQALAAGVVLCGLVLVSLPSRQTVEEDDRAMRGTPLQQITTPDAALRRNQLLQDLRAAGLDAQPYERLGRLGIDVSLPVPLPRDQAAALKRLGLKPPPGPSLQIELLAPEPPRP